MGYHLLVEWKSERKYKKMENGKSGDTSNIVDDSTGWGKNGINYWVVPWVKSVANFYPYKASLIERKIDFSSL